MSQTLLTPSQIQTNWLTYLGNLKPGVDISLTDSDWWIRGAVVGGVVAGVYADNLAISNDAFPQNARQDAIAQWLQTLFGNDPVQGNFLPPTNSQGFAAVTGNPGQVIAINLQANYGPNGDTYIVQTSTTLDPIAGTGLVPFQSVNTGQTQNLQGGAILTFPSPPPGLNSTAIVASGGFSDATDPETLPQARSRVLTRLRTPLSVGRVSDYIQYAKEADPSVTSASVDRYAFGLGTVAVYITSGTNNIDAAVNAGIPISVIPSQQLIDIVQAFLNINSPVTACVSVLAPASVLIDVMINCTFLSGDQTTVVSDPLNPGKTITQGQMVIREASRALYKTPVGGRQIGASGFVVASDIEQTIDISLSDEPFETGTTTSIILDRNVLPLSSSGYNRGLLPNQVPIPGTITIVEM